MSPALFSLALASSQAGQGATVGTARWSPYSLLIVIAMCFISLILATVLLILLISGRFRRQPPGRATAFEVQRPEIEEDAAAELDQFEDVEDIDPKQVEKEKPWIKVKNFIVRHFEGRTGLWQNLAGILVSLLALVSVMGLESIYGRMVAFTDCTLLLLLLLAFQIFMAAWLWKLQRRRR